MSARGPGLHVLADMSAVGDVALLPAGHDLGGVREGVFVLGDSDVELEAYRVAGRRLTEGLLRRDDWLQRPAFAGLGDGGGILGRAEGWRHGYLVGELPQHRTGENAALISRDATDKPITTPQSNFSPEPSTDCWSFANDTFRWRTPTDLVTASSAPPTTAPPAPTLPISSSSAPRLARDE